MRQINLQLAAAGCKRGAMLDSNRCPDRLFAGAYPIGKVQLAGHYLHDPIYDTAVYCINGLDPVHAKKGLVSDAFPSNRYMVGGLFLLWRVGVSDEPTRIPISHDHAEKRHAEYPGKP